MRVCSLLRVLIAVNLLAFPVSPYSLVLTPFQKTVEIGGDDYFLLSALNGDKTEESIEVTVKFLINHPDIIKVSPEELTILVGNKSEIHNITIHPLHLGHAQVLTSVTPAGVFVNDAVFIDVTVELLNELGLISYDIGWMYFIAWSISFYPQILENWKRKSVVGLNFDFLALNFLGFALYSAFNCGFFWSKAIKDQYRERYPRSANPVFLNDVVFALHATAATCICIIQCFVYERAAQRVSWTARGIIAGFSIVVIVAACCSGAGILLWLDFLYICSYVKLAITLIKYVPQAYMNYKRKSTIGWSIGNILLDFTGGLLSMLQMIINSINLDDWLSIFGDPTKFGLGLFSVIFDIFFVIQHFILYRDQTSESESGSEEGSGEERSGEEGSEEEQSDTK